MKRQVYISGIIFTIWNIDIIRMCSWFWVKWCNYLCCIMFNCWVIYSKWQKTSLQWPKALRNISAAVHTMTKSFVPFCLAQDGEFSTASIMLHIWCIACDPSILLWSTHLHHVMPVCCFVCLFVVCLLFVCLFVYREVWLLFSLLWAIMTSSLGSSSAHQQHMVRLAPSQWVRLW